MPKQEITLAELLTSCDWEEVFGEGSGGNCDKATDEIPPGAEGIDKTPPLRTDVAEVLAATGSCDYTGWDCRAGNSLQIARSIDDALQYGLTAEQRTRLEI